MIDKPLWEGKKIKISKAERQMMVMDKRRREVARSHRSTLFVGGHDEGEGGFVTADEGSIL